MSLELVSVAEDRTTKVPAFGRRPAHTAPDPFGPSHWWWVCGSGVTCPLFGLCLAGSHGRRPGHQALAPEPHPQAWLQGGAPVTRIRARDTKNQLSYSSLGFSELPFVWPLPPDLFAMGDPTRGIKAPDN